MPRFFLLALVALLALGCPRFDSPEANDVSVNGGTEENQNQTEYRPDPDLRCPVEVVYAQAQSAGSVTVSGEFNEWSIEAQPLERDGGAWRTELELAPGHHGFKFVIDGAYEGAPPPYVYTKWVGNELNRNLIVEDCSRPALEVQNLEVTPGGRVEATLRFERSIYDSPIDEASLQVRLGNETVTANVDGDRITISHQLTSHGKYSLRVSARDELGRRTLQDPLFLPLWHEARDFEWFDATMYLIFTDRFRQAGERVLGPIDGVPMISNYKGGNFRGITETINEGYFDDLGVNLLWLNPVNENTDKGEPGAFDDNMYTGYHGYWTVDPLVAEKRFGDGDVSADERLHEMIAAAHGRGIRVMFDLVLNHVHEDHIYCQSHPSWCDITCVCGSEGCGWDERTLDCQFTSYMPNLNYRNHEILERVVDDVMAFIEKFDIDAVRIDAAKHMEHVIMRTIRLRLNELEQMGGAPFYVVGETFTGEFGHDQIMAYVADYELHGQFDFPLLYPIRRVFGHNHSFGELEEGMRRSEQAYGSTYPWHSPFIGNHDIVRFVTAMVGNGVGRFGGTEDLMANGPQDHVDQQWIIDRMAMAHAFLLTIPGIPLLYYGDEIGLAGDHDPDNRRMMQWNHNANQRALLERVQQAGQIRQQVDALRHGDRRELWIDAHYYAFSRDAGERGRAVVAMNKDDFERTEQVILPSHWPRSEQFYDHVSGQTLTSHDGELAIPVGSWRYAILEAVQ